MPPEMLEAYRLADKLAELWLFGAVSFFGAFGVGLARGWMAETRAWEEARRAWRAAADA